MRRRHLHLFVSFFLLLLKDTAEAWILTSKVVRCRQLQSQLRMDNDNANDNIRRKVLVSIPTTVLITGLGWNFEVEPTTAVVMERPKEKIFTAGEALGVEASKVRFQEARRTLDYLLNNYDAISKEGGDNVRRYLGTVGTTSALYGITKVLKELQEEANDIVEYVENMEDFDYWLQAADTAAYSSIFVEYSAAKTKPEVFLNEAKVASQKMQQYMKKMASELSF